MVVGEGSDLRQMGYTKDLVRSGQRFEFPSNRFGRASANA